MYIPTLDEKFYEQPINLDITNRCPLQCPACLRQSTWYNKIRKLYKEMTIDEIIKIAKTFPCIAFSGQQSDPLCHPDILDFIWIAGSIKLEIHTATSHKNKEFYKEAFNRSGKRVTWIFGLDGLPEDSYKYRVNQDGVHLFEMMKMGSKMGVNIVWQYIVFKYNQNNIEQSKQMAEDYNMEFRLSKSSRWGEEMIDMKPEEFYCA